MYYLYVCVQRLILIFGGQLSDGLHGPPLWILNTGDLFNPLTTNSKVYSWFLSILKGLFNDTLNTNQGLY